MGSDFVPVIDYRQASKNNDERLSHLWKQFQSRFNKSPEIVVRVPGRVNLIGEHIDYHGFSVLPMAIENDILIAVSSNEQSQIHLTNVDNKYEEYCDLTTTFRIESPPLWYHYFLCGYRGITEKNNKENDGVSNGHITSFLPAVNACVSGTIPPNAGLSSSSALVCASALATMCLCCEKNAITSLRKSEIAEISTSSERYIGTQGGGMDQAIAFLAEDGCAQLIDFEPSLKSTNVVLPGDAVFYVIHSGKTLNKAATHHYNTRVFETRVAAAIIAKKCGVIGGDISGEKQYLSLRDVAIALGKSLEQMSSCLNEYLNATKDYLLDDILQELNVNESQLLAIISGHSENVAAKFRDVLSDVKAFRLYQRTLHVYKEANRVIKMKVVCDTDVNTEEKLRLIGTLMNESHSSCKNLYDCSCQELDETVSFALEAGALGARLTGAGWGGCVVALVRKKECTQFEDNLSKHPKMFFRSKPSRGATVYQIS